MADKPSNVNMNTLRTGLEGRGGISTVGMSAEFAPVDLAADEAINVEGHKVITVYNEGGTAAVASVAADVDDPTFVGFEDTNGSISVTPAFARVIDVSGVPLIRFDEPVTVILAS